MPLFLIPVLKFATPVLISVATVFATEYARSAAKSSADKQHPNDVYETEYQKHRARKDADKEMYYENFGKEGDV
jgi:hypothetical protein